jgi:glycerol-3-phosphate dehydrogenase (NAD(P)+)
MIGIVGAGAFGAALAVALGREQPVTLWGRGLTSRSIARLPGVILPENVTITAKISDISEFDTVLLALPMQVLGRFLAGGSWWLAARGWIWKPGWGRPR